MLLPYPIIRLKKGKEKSLLQKHPWVFSGAIHEEPQNLEEGEIVQVVNHERQYLATGHFHRGTITVRCFDFNQSHPDADLFTKKINEAISLRKSLMLPSGSTNCYRLIHGEGDGFPGLIIDIYGDTAVMQCHSAGMYRMRMMLCQILVNQCSGIKAVYDKSTDTMSKHGHQSDGDGFLYKEEGYAPPEYVLESGLKYSVDFISGQKTGFFLDQRENRSLLARYAKGKNVLNTFCYTGGFSIAALHAEAHLVHSVDSSKRAIEGLEKNLQLNSFGGEHQSYCADVISHLRQSETVYDVVVLDPPAYAKHLNQTQKAMIGYRSLNTEGFKKIKSGGILFTFSCSQAIDKELFRKIVFQSALQSKREVRILHQLSQPPDHPINIFHPESEYLKGLVLYVS